MELKLRSTLSFPVFLNAFNRTAYGIEIWNVEVKIVIESGLLIAPLMELK